MVTHAGGGYSRWKDLAVTRWREDGTRDHWGTFCYLRDVDSGAVWSTAYQPTLQRAEHYEAIFSEGRAEFRRRDGDFDTHTEIAVSPEDDIELRRVRITNRSAARRTVEVTSYAEVVLAASAADALHPAFSNLFVQTEIVEPHRAILCTRRPRSRDEPVPWMFHLMAVHDADVGEFSYETDRAALHRPRPHRRRPPGDGRMPWRCPEARAPCSTPWRPSAVGLPSRRNNRPAWTWFTVSATAARRPWVWSRNIRIGASPTASSTWPGPTPRWCCARSTPGKRTRSSMAAWPTRSSTPMARCAPTAAC